MPFKTGPLTDASGDASALAIRLSRRQFQLLTVAGAAGLAMSRQSAAESSTDAGWIDAHVHVWTPDTERYPLAPSYSIADMQPARFTPEQLFAHAKPAGVSRIVLIQMSFYGFDNSYMLDTIASNPQVFSGVGIVDSHASDVAAKIGKLAAQGVRGLRIHPGPGEAAGWVSDPGMAIVCRTAREQGIAICPLINPVDLPHVDSLCKRYPEMRVVVDHFARIGMDGSVDADSLDALCRLARHPHAYVKTSAFYALGKKQAPYVDLLPMIRRLVDAYGPERLMWASDCPFQVQAEHSYAASIALIRDRADFLSDDDKRWILRDTAASVFFA